MRASKKKNKKNQRIKGKKRKITSRSVFNLRTKSKKKKTKLKKQKFALQGRGFLAPALSKAMDLVGWMKNSANLVLNPAKTLTLMPKPVQDFLTQFGDSAILSMAIVREPIGSVIKHLIDVSTKGSFLEKAKKLAYDDIFHLSCRFTITTSNGTSFFVKAEKNARVVIGFANNDKLKPGGAIRPVPLYMNPSINVNSFMLKGAHERTWLYDTVDWNCQKWMQERLQMNGLLTPDLDFFIKQDTETLLPSEKLKQIMKHTTNIGNILDNLFHGG